METFNMTWALEMKKRLASISKQANNYWSKFVDRNINTDKVIYKYTPALNMVLTKLK
jgi:hypothetical protein